MHNFGHEYVDTYIQFFPRIFQSFQICLVLIVLCCLKTYCYKFDIERDILYSLHVLKKQYFSIFHTNYSINISPNPRALANLACQSENKLK